MTAATAPGAARGRAREEPRDERSSRTTMTKSISRSQVRPIASTNALFGGGKARYYLLTLVFHDQADSIAEAVKGYEVKLARADLPNIPFHSEPLMNGHKDLLHDSYVIVRCL